MFTYCPFYAVLFFSKNKLYVKLIVSSCVQILSKIFQTLLQFLDPSHHLFRRRHRHHQSICNKIQVKYTFFKIRFKNMNKKKINTNTNVMDLYLYKLNTGKLSLHTKFKFLRCKEVHVYKC